MSIPGKKIVKMHLICASIRIASCPNWVSKHVLQMPDRVRRVKHTLHTRPLRIAASTVVHGESMQFLFSLP